MQHEGLVSKSARSLLLHSDSQVAVCDQCFRSHRNEGECYFSHHVQAGWICQGQLSNHALVSHRNSIRSTCFFCSGHGELPNLYQVEKNWTSCRVKNTWIATIAVRSKGAAKCDFAQTFDTFHMRPFRLSEIDVENLKWIKCISFSPNITLYHAITPSHYALTKVSKRPAAIVSLADLFPWHYVFVRQAESHANYQKADKDMTSWNIK